MTTVALWVLALLAPLVLFDALARPTIRRLAVRNVARRPGEAALVIGGSLLAGALITASFVIGDSFGASIRNLAADRWGPTDELVTVADPARLDAVAAEIDRLPADRVDGVLAVTFLDLPVGSTGAQRRVEPELRLLEADPAAAVTYSGDGELVGGGVDATLSPDQVVLSRRAAEELEVDVGGAVEVFVDGRPARFEVASIRPARGLTGFADLVVAPGAITGGLADVGAVATTAVLVSNAGDLFSGAQLTGEVEAALNDGRLGEGVEVVAVKQRLLDEAAEEAAETTELFGTIGGFSVAAGILLVVNLFVMLAAERKSEMGTMRAVGLRRGHLSRALSLEGAIYGLAAAVAGAAAGIGVAAVVMVLAGDLADGEANLTLSVEATSLLSGAVIGLAVSQLTVAITSWRVTRVNIVRALRDLPEPRSAGRARRQLVLGAAGVAAGVGLYIVAPSTPVVAMVAPVLVLVSLVPLSARVLPHRLAVVAACGGALAWVVAVFGLLPDVMAEPEVYLFLLQGVLLVALATAMVAALDRLWLAAARGLTRGSIASRVGLAEPLARPVRTALLVAMYSLIVFTLTFIAVINSVFQAQAPDFARQAGGGYELYVDANPLGGFSASELAGRDEVRAVAPVWRGQLDGRSPQSPPEQVLYGWSVTGIEPSFLATDPPQLYSRSSEFASDAEVWAAISRGEPYVVLDGEDSLAAGDRYELGLGGRFQTFTVAGTTEQGWLVDAGMIMPAERATELFADGRPPTRYYVDLDVSADPAVLARDLTDGGLEQGIDARTFLSAAKAETDAQETFLWLLQSYLALGLLIGIAGLGVVLVRAVRERQRQFGVMRALGIAAPVVRRTFVIEAAFVACQGVALGVGLGLLSSWQLLTGSEAFERDLDYAVPTMALILLAGGCLLASLLMAAAPAVRAGRTAPAVALRMTN
jgi:putative ABC transport system permease protein